MKNKRIFIMVLLLALLLVAGCTNSSTEILKPPNLVISVDGKTIQPIVGTYSWSHENSDGTSTAIHADSDAPPGLVKDQEPFIVTPSSEMTFDFETPPTKYEIRTWDEDYNVTGTYDKLDLSEHEGTIIFEVLAHWEQGTASYTFLLRVK